MRECKCVSIVVVTTDVVKQLVKSYVARWFLVLENYTWTMYILTSGQIQQIEHLCKLSVCFQILQEHETTGILL